MRLYGSICPIYNREVNDDCRRCGRFYSGNATGIECDSSPMDIPNISSVMVVPTATLLPRDVPAGMR